jgi:hypothetical protein
VSLTLVHGQLLSSLHSGLTGNHLQRLPLVLGMPVMATQNISLESGIVNGTIGRIKSIHYKLSPDSLRILTSCTIHIPHNSHDCMPGLHDRQFLVLPDATSFRYSHQKRGISFTVRRKQCPLIPAFTMTTHKSQGQSLQKVVVDLESCSGTEAPYVMVLQATSLEGLLIYWSFAHKKIQCNMSQDSREEEQRLHLLHMQTARDFPSPALAMTAGVNHSDSNPPSAASGSRPTNPTPPQTLNLHRPHSSLETQTPADGPSHK